MSPGYHAPSSRGGVRRNARPPQSMHVICGRARSRLQYCHRQRSVTCRRACRGRRVARAPDRGTSRVRHPADHRQGARGRVQRTREPRPRPRCPRRRSVRGHRRARHRGALAWRRPLHVRRARPQRRAHPARQHRATRARGAQPGARGRRAAARRRRSTPTWCSPTRPTTSTPGRGCWPPSGRRSSSPKQAARSSRSTGSRRPAGRRPAASATDAPGSRSSSTSTGNRPASRYRLETDDNGADPGQLRSAPFGPRRHRRAVGGAVRRRRARRAVQPREAVRPVHPR